MPRKKLKRQRRRCTICDKTGHDRRNCLLRKEKMKSKKISTDSQDLKALENTAESSKVAKQKRGKASTFVRVYSKSSSSPHVINLKNEKVNNEWNKVFGYRENKKEIVHQTLDLAEIVNHANTKEKEEKEIKKAVSTINKKLRVFGREIKKQNFKKIKIKKTNFELPVAPKKIKLQNNKFLTKKIPFSFSFISLKNILPNFNPRLSLPSLTFSLTRKKLIYLAVCSFLLLAVPFPSIAYYQKLKLAGNKVIEESTGAFLALQSSTVSAFSADIDKAEYDLASALQSFDRANTILEKDYYLIMSVAKLLPIVGTQISSRQHILKAGQHLALGNTYLIKGIDQANQSEDSPLTERFSIVRRHIQSSIPQYKEALLELSAVKSRALPVEYQQPFEDFKLLFTTFIDDMNDLTSLVDAVETIFGQDDFRRYLIVFQNHHELRATGGFMGSFALVDVQKGKILNIDVPGGGTYDLQGQLDEFVKPPLPLQLVNNRWEFQDANWFPDFAATAKKIDWFYQHGRGATVDGVIAINASVLERFLTVVGPVENEDYNVLLNAETALQTLQNKVEIDYDRKENQPKKILSNLLEQFLTGLQNINTVDSVRLLTQLHEAMEHKEIQVYIEDSFTQKQLREFGWTGEILQSNKEQDYLYVVNTNIGGGKSDARTDQKIEHQSSVQEDGSIIDTVIIRRKHAGRTYNPLYSGSNISYLRVYTPEGSELLEAGGFVYPPEEAFKVPESWYEEDKDLLELEKDEKIHIESGTRMTEEFNKTVFGNWIVTNPGEESVVYFTYRLPFSISLKDDPEKNINKWKKFFIQKQSLASRYGLFIQKQSGTIDEFSTRVIYPDSWYPVWRSRDDIDLALNGASYEGILETDLFLGLVMGSDSLK